MREIPLTQGKMALVDDRDFEWLSQWKWCACKGRTTYYAIRGWQQNGKMRIVQMHRAILNPHSGIEADHINGDGLDNRRTNLRTCTSSQNHANSRKRANCSSLYKGVSWYKRKRKWYSCISVKGRTRALGYFDDEQEAARVYNHAAISVFGEFARLNNIRSEEAT